MADIYSTTPYEKRIEAARTAAQSQFGSTDPSAVKAALAEQTFAQDQPFQQAVGQQSQAVDALSQLADYDRKLAQESSAANVQLGSQQAQQREQFRQMGRIDPTSAAATTAMGPATFDTAQIQQQSTVPGLISPFAASGIATGQTGAALDVYDSASAARAARERLLGSDIAAMAGAYAERIRQEEAEKEREEQRKSEEFDRGVTIAKLTGQKQFRDPFTGEVHDIASDSNLTEGEREASALRDQLKLDISNRMTPRDLFSKYSGVIDFNQIMTEYNKLGGSPWGPAKESAQELRNLYEASKKGTEGTGSASELRGEYIKQSDTFVKIRDAYNRLVSADDSAAGDLNLIFGYMRILDPGSTVREGEFANAQNTAGVPEQIRNLYNRALSGERLSPKQRSEFRKQAGSIYSGAQRQQQQLTDEYSRLSEQLGVDPSLVIVGMEQAQQERIRVRLKSSGQTGTIPANEFNPDLYERL